jgi:hypothetical protein
MAGIGNIPWTAFNAWASRYRLDASEFDFLWKMLMELDAEYLQHLEKQNANTP